MEYTKKPFCVLKARKSKHGFKAYGLVVNIPAIGRALEQLNEFPTTLYQVTENNGGGLQTITIHTDDDKVAQFLTDNYCVE